MQGLSYRDTWVLVTGAGAPKRIGATIAEHFAQRGASIYLHEIRASEGAGAVLDRVSTVAKDNGGRAELLTGDLTSPAVVASLFNAMNPPPDIVINNAGLFRAVRATHDMPLSAYLEAHSAAASMNVDANFRTALLVTEAAIHTWKKLGRTGVVIFEGDAFIDRGGTYPGDLVAYAASKSYLSTAVRQFATEYGRSGIRFFGILNGAIEPPPSAPYETVAHMRDEIPLPDAALSPWLGAERVAEAMDALIRAPGVSGTTVTVDGGRSWTTKREV